MANAISDGELERARQRGREEEQNVPHVVEAVYSATLRRVLLLFDNGLEIALRQDDFRWMQHATSDQLSEIELLVDGHVLYFPELDEGFDVPELLEHLLGVRRFLSARVESERGTLARAAAA